MARVATKFPSATLRRRVEGSFTYEGPRPSHTRPVRLKDLSPTVRACLQEAKRHVVRGEWPAAALGLEGCFALVGPRTGRVFGYAVFAAHRATNYTVSRFIAFSPTGRRLGEKVSVGD